MESGADPGVTLTGFRLRGVKRCGRGEISGGGVFPSLRRCLGAAGTGFYGSIVFNETPLGRKFDWFPEQGRTPPKSAPGKPWKTVYPKDGGSLGGDVKQRI